MVLPSDTTPESGERIHRKILIPLGVTLVVFIAVFLLSARWFLQQEMRRDLKGRQQEIDTLFNELVEERSKLMRSFLQQALQNGDLQKAMRSGDRDSLLSAAESLVQPLSPNGVVSHLYFIDPQGKVILRLHAPERSGDIIGRRTFRSARESGVVAAGLELGPLGTFTLRVVAPWTVNGRLLGYVEAGEDVGHLIRKLSKIGQFHYLLTIHKDFLDPAAWEQGMSIFGRTAEWKRYPDRVIVDQSVPGISPELNEILTLGGVEGKELFLRHNGRIFYGTFFPLDEFGDRHVGDLLVMLDVTEIQREFRLGMIAVILFCFLLGGALLLTTSLGVGRLDHKLAVARQRLEEEVTRTRRANDLLEDEIQERRMAEAALAEARDELEAKVAERTAELAGILRSVEDILFAVDDRGRVILLNGSAEAFFGRTQERSQGRRVEEVIASAVLLEHVRESLKLRRSTGHFDFRLPAPDGKKDRIMQARISVIGKGVDDFGGIAFLVQDVTDVREMDRLKNEFISTAAHELRTPMTTILGYSELLLSPQEFSTEEQREFLSLICEKAESIAVLLDDLLDLSRLESGRSLDLHAAPIRADDLLRPPVAHYQKIARCHSFEVDLADGEAVISADAGKIAQVLENLLSNAVKYSPGGGLVRIAGCRRDGRYRVTVQDEGIGMTPEQTRLAFQKFYRADSTETAIQGTGLGLTIVRQIVEAHGGRIWIESRFGEGTAVHFTLPLA